MLRTDGSISSRNSESKIYRKALAFLNILSVSMGAVMAACFPFSFAIFNIGIVVLIASFILKRFWEKDASLYDPWLDASLLLFFLACSFTVFSSIDRSLSLQGVHKLLRYLALFIAAREMIRTPRHLAILTAALLIGGWIGSLDGILQFVFGEDPLRGRTPHLGFDSLLRITACFPNPNAFAAYLSILIPFSFAYARYGKRHRIFHWATFLIMSTALVMTYSRTAAMAIAAAIFFLLVLRKDFFLLAGFAALAGMTFFLLPASIRDWAAGALGTNPFKELLVDHTRVLHHQAAWNAFAQHPIFGVGLNTFDAHYQLFRAANDPFARWSAHHAYLQLASETGIAGFGSFLFFLAVLTGFLFKYRRDPAANGLDPNLMAYAAGVIGFLVTGFFESNLWQPRQTYFFWFFCALLCATVKRNSGKINAAEKLTGINR